MLQRPPGMSRDKFVWEWTKTRGWVPEQEQFTVRIAWDGAGGCTLEEVAEGAGAEQDEAARELAEMLRGARLHAPRDRAAHENQQEHAAAHVSGRPAGTRNPVPSPHPAASV